MTRTLEARSSQKVINGKTVVFVASTFVRRSESGLLKALRLTGLFIYPATLLEKGVLITGVLL